MRSHGYVCTYQRRHTKASTLAGKKFKEEQVLKNAKILKIKETFYDIFGSENELSFSLALKCENSPVE